MILLDVQFSQGAYGILLLLGIAASISIWMRLVRSDSRLLAIYLAALGGAFFGAKVIYLVAEGWLHWHDENRWVVLATGKSILGALLGGYAGVEIAKKLTGYTEATGDLFAVVAPVGISLGRVGCILNGCCLGRVWEPHWYTPADVQGICRWPAAQLELVFNLLAFTLVLSLRWKGILQGQLFHVYLMAYGTFRFWHEASRETPRIWGAMTGYQFGAALVFVLGAVGFAVRRWQYSTRLQALPTHPLNDSQPRQACAPGRPLPK